MNTNIYVEGKQSLSSILDKAMKKGEVRIKRKDGQVFVVRPESKTKSPLDVEGIDLGLTAKEIVEAVHAGRKLY
jgi:hypothetical protein